ncbi:hypothetical protein [Mariniflexile sp.]|uniref:hypothetical protein n=1 Tax=Mariniflexile sp. TaxID=1979402 RepID=UPI004047648E
MKIFKTLSLFIASITFVFLGCQPIVDSDTLTNTTDVEGVKLVATQSSPGGNLIELSLATPGITGYWDYNLGRAFSDKVEFVYPIPGTATFTFTGTLGAEFFTKTIDVQIDVLDNELNQDWYDLVSQNTATGKTWVFDGGPVPDSKKWWYMSPPNDPSSYETAWWNAAGDCCPPVDAAGSMTFDLDGGANFTYISGPGATPKAGSFVLDVKNQVLKIINANILGAEEPRGNPNGVYKIISLTETEMILYVDNNGGGTGWTWVFKPQ